MNPLRKKAREELAETLRKHLIEINCSLNRNRYQMKRLVEEQTILKRKRAEISMVINTLLEKG